MRPTKDPGATDHLSLPGTGTERKQGSHAAAVATWGYFCLAQTRVNNTSFPYVVSNHTYTQENVYPHFKRKFFLWKKYLIGKIGCETKEYIFLCFD